MKWPFVHTAKERGLWRGWLKNGQSVELSWKRRGWEFGGGVHVHSDDCDNGSRMLFLKFWRFTAIIPLGIMPGPISIDDEPQWSAYASSEFGLTFHWGRRRKSFDWPWSFDWHRTSYRMADGSWLHELRSDRPGVNKNSRFKTNGDHWSHIYDQRKAGEWRAKYPYTYRLCNGDVQNVTATVTVREYERRRRFLRWTKIGAKVSRSIDIDFSEEVGERAGSWKGGCIGCGWDMQPGETPEMSLRRMERERRFD